MFHDAITFDTSLVDSEYRDKLLIYIMDIEPSMNITQYIYIYIGYSLIVTKVTFHSFNVINEFTLFF